MAGTQRNEKVLLFGAIGENLTLDRAFKLQVAKEVGFRHMKVRKMDMLGRRKTIKTLK